MKRIHWLAAGAAASAVFGVSGTAQAAGFLVQEQSARAVGRAFSGEAADTGPASLWWNPASIMGMESRGEIYVGAHAIDVNAKVRDTGSTIRRPTLPVALPVGGSAEQKNPIDFGFVPNLNAAYKVHDRVALGIAVNAPFNFTTRYDINSFTRYQALKSMLMNIDVQPTVAVKITDNLDVGAGFDFSYANAKLSNALPNLSPLLADGYQRLSGDGWDYGWNAGLRLHSERGALAVSYRSQIKHRLDGRVEVAGLLGPAAAANVDAPGQANFTTPWILTLGGRVNVTPRLTLNGQVQRIGLSQFDAIRVSYGGRFSVTPQNYKNTTTWAVGADYKVNDKLTWRAGLQRDPTPTEILDRTARVPDSNRWLYATGGSYDTGRGIIDLSVAYIHFADARFQSDATAFGGTPLATPVAMNGTISGRGLVGSIGYRFAF
jgi:long-chain fatty acid transport protein